jgi:flagellar biogenesis protein FliO
MLVVCTITRVSANDWAVEIPTSQGTAADQSPRYLPQEPSTARPLEPAEPRTRDVPQAQVAETPRPGGLIPRPPAERLASGSEDQAAPQQTVTQLAAEPRAALPLAIPPQDARGPRPKSEMPALATGAASLAIVVGLFFVVVWAVRRGMPKGAGMLPREALEVLGRAPLVGKQQVHLVRCGNKVILVCVCGLSVQTLTEITDPAEVERLTELCQPSSVTSAAGFGQVLKQFSNSSRRGGFYGNAHGEPDFGALDTDLQHVRGSLV